MPDRLLEVRGSWMGSSMARSAIHLIVIHWYRVNSWSCGRKMRRPAPVRSNRGSTSVVGLGTYGSGVGIRIGF